MCACVRACVRPFLQKNTANEFLKHSKESRGVLGQAGKQAGKQVGKLKQRSSSKGAQAKEVCVLYAIEHSEWL